MSQSQQTGMLSHAVPSGHAAVLPRLAAWGALQRDGLCTEVLPPPACGLLCSVERGRREGGGEREEGRGRRGEGGGEREEGRGRRGEGGGEREEGRGRRGEGGGEREWKRGRKEDEIFLHTLWLYSVTLADFSRSSVLALA